MPVSANQPSLSSYDAKRVTGTPPAPSALRDAAGVILLIIILAASPFFQGLFYDRQVLYFTFVVGILAALTIRFVQRLELAELALLGLALWYVLVIPTSVNKGDAITGTVRMLSYASLFCAARRILTPSLVNSGAWLLCATMTALVLAGVGSSVQLPPIEDGWSRGLSSFLQYHNALGGYLLMGLPISAALYRDSKVWWRKQLAASFFYFQILGLIGSQSRGAWICFVIILPLLLAGFRFQPRSMLSLLLISWAALDDWSQVVAAKEAHSLAVLLWPFAGLAVVWISVSVVEKLSVPVRIQSPVSLKKENAAKINLIPLLLLVAVLLLAVVPVVHPKTNSELATLQRAKSISFADTSATERIRFYHDAVKMACARPVTGFGAGGWSAAFRRYQTTVFHAKNTHSEPMEILVEAGWPALGFYALFWISFFVHWFRSFKQRPAGQEYLLGVGVIGIFLHSLIDFDLSESAIFFTVLLVVAASCPSRGAPHEPEAPGAAKTKTKTALAIRIIFAAILILISPILLAGVSCATAAAKALKAGHVDQAIKYYRLGLRFFPFQAMVRSDLAQLEIARGIQTADAALVTHGIAEMDLAIKYNSMDPMLRHIAARVFAAAGLHERAYREAKENLNLAPLIYSSYEALPHYGLPYARQLIGEDKIADARVVLNELLDLPRRVESRLNGVRKEYWGLESPYGISPGMRQLLNEAQALRDAMPQNVHSIVD